MERIWAERLNGVGSGYAIVDVRGVCRITSIVIPVPVEKTVELAFVETTRRIATVVRRPIVAIDQGCVVRPPLQLSVRDRGV